MCFQISSNRLSSKPCSAHNLVELEKPLNMNVSLLTSASKQPRTSTVKFVRSRARIRQVLIERRVTAKEPTDRMDALAYTIYFSYLAANLSADASRPMSIHVLGCCWRTEGFMNFIMLHSLFEERSSSSQPLRLDVTLVGPELFFSNLR